MVSFFDYSLYGQLLDQRHGNAGDGYLYGFQGQLKDDEIKGEGNSLNYEYRMHDPRIGRFFAVDPLAWKYAYNSPYAFSENKVIAWIELEGLESHYGNYLEESGIDPVVTEERLRINQTPILASIGLGAAVLSVGTMAYGVTTMAAWTLEEGVEYVIESATGVPILIDPFDVVEQLVKKGFKKAATDVIVEGKKFVKGTNLTTIKSWAYNVKTYGHKAAEALSKGKISIQQLKKGLTVSGRKVWQSKTAEAIEAYGDVKDGATLFRIGKTDKQKTGDAAQYWSIEDPRIDPQAYADKYNMRVEDVLDADFIETAKVKNGGDFITREAGTMPGANNKGQGIEVVVPVGGTTGNKIIDLKKP